MARIGRTAAVALAFIAVGFLLIFFAWNGAARVDFPQAQIPYLLSGGAAGLGFIGLGAAMLIFESGRRATGRLEERLTELTEIVRTMQAPEAPAIAASVVAARPARNGSTVIVGRSSFHRPECRLVEGKDGLEESSRDAAVAAGLQPCRVCDPLGAAEAPRRARR